MDDGVEEPPSRHRQGVEPLVLASVATAALALVLAILSLWRPLGWFAVVAAVAGMGLAAYGMRRRVAGQSGDLVPGGGERPESGAQPSSWALGALAGSGVALVLGLIAAVGLVGGSGAQDASQSSPAAGTPDSPVASLPESPGADLGAPGAASPTSVGTLQSGSPSLGVTLGQTTGPIGRAPTVSAPSDAPLVPGTDPGWPRPERAVPLGQAIQLITKQDRVAVDVTATTIDKNASAVPATLLPTPGHRFYAVSYTVRAVGAASYAQPSSSQLCRLVTADGVAHRPSYFMAGNGPALDAAPLIAAGSSATGWVLFEIPDDKEPIAVAYSPTAEWRLP